MLTGLTRHRLGWRKKMVLQVSLWRRRFRPGFLPDTEPWETYWRDATFRDVIDLGAREFSSAPPPTEKMRPLPPHGLPPARNPGPKMPVTEPARPADFQGVGKIDYRFLGMTGEEQT